MIAFFAVIASFRNVYGYLDPGTGSAIAGSIWPLIVAFFTAIGAFLVKYFWNPIKRLFSRLSGKKGK